ncbi:MAG: carbohydrate kinase [Opitutales bacterium]|nr:carbohydrate kinase [Opitutales bacterium]
MSEIVGIGEILWDVFGDKKTLGGAPANFSYHAACQGASAHLVSAIGDDPLGDAVIAALASKSVDLQLQRVPAPTGTVTVSLDAAGVAHYDFPDDVAWDHLQTTPQILDLAARTDAVCFGSLAQRSPRSRETIRAFLKAVPANAIRVFDANLRQNFYDPALLADSLSLATMLKINEEELEIFKRLLNAVPATREAFAGTLFRRYPAMRYCVLTLGADGSEIWSADGEHSRLPGDSSVCLVDTVGAGDSFTATLLAALLAGTPLARAHAHAARVSAFVCSREGAMPELPQNLKL